MKKLWLILLLISTFSVSKAQDVPKEVIDWCLAVRQQNKELWTKVAVKDTTIVKQDKLLKSDSTKMASYERDLSATEIKSRAFREESIRKDTIIMELKKDIKKANTKTGFSIGILGTVIILILAL